MCWKRLYRKQESIKEFIYFSNRGLILLETETYPTENWTQLFFKQIIMFHQTGLKLTGLNNFFIILTCDLVVSYMVMTCVLCIHITDRIERWTKEFPRLGLNNAFQLGSVWMFTMPSIGCDSRNWILYLQPQLYDKL